MSAERVGGMNGGVVGIHDAGARGGGGGRALSSGARKVIAGGGDTRAAARLLAVIAAWEVRREGCATATVTRTLYLDVGCCEGEGTCDEVGWVVAAKAKVNNPSSQLRLRLEAGRAIISS